MAKVKIKDIDKGYKKFLENVSKLNSKPYVKVGVLESAGKHEDSDLTNAELMSIHEFGAPSVNIPERAPIRKTIDTKRDEIYSFKEKLLDKVLSGAMDSYNALKLIGEDVKRKIKQTIKDGLTPPNTTETILKKGSSTPLVDTGQLINSIDYEVVMKTTVKPI